MRQHEVTYYMIFIDNDKCLSTRFFYKNNFRLGFMQVFIGGGEW